MKDYRNTSDPKVRQAFGMLCGGTGIALNACLFLLKFIAGALSGSIAITADAFNNLSDAGSSVITLSWKTKLPEWKCNLYSVQMASKLAVPFPFPRNTHQRVNF